MVPAAAETSVKPIWFPTGFPTCVTVACPIGVMPFRVIVRIASMVAFVKLKVAIAPFPVVGTPVTVIVTFWADNSS